MRYGGLKISPRYRHLINTSWAKSDTEVVPIRPHITIKLMTVTQKHKFYENFEFQIISWAEKNLWPLRLHHVPVLYNPAVLQPEQVVEGRQDGILLALTGHQYEIAIAQR